MKAYKVLLSVVLCLAMVLGMAGAYAEPVSGKWTLRNVSITMNDEEIVIGPEASLSASLEEDALKLHIEALNGEDVLVPVSAEINRDGLLLSMDDSGRVYSLGVDTMLKMIGLGEEDMQALELIERVIDWIRKLAEIEYTPEMRDQFLSFDEGFYSALAGNAAEAVEVEIDGQTYAAKSYKGDMTLGNTIAALDFVRTCELEIMAEYAQLILDIFNLSEGEQLGSFEDWFLVTAGTADDPDAAAEMAEMMETTFGQIEVISALEDDYTITQMGMEMAEEYGGMSAYVDSFGTAEKADMSFGMNITEDGEDIAAVQVDMAATNEDLTMTMDMAINDYGTVTTVDVDASIDTENTAITVNVEEADEDYGYSDVISAEFTADTQTAALTVEQNSAYGEGYANTTNLTCDMDLADGEVVAFDADMDYDSGYSFTDEEGNVDAMSTTVTLNAEGAKSDGLWEMSMNMDMGNEFCYGPADEAEVYSDGVVIDFSYAETAEEDGSITSAIDASVSAEDESYAASFEINASEGAILPDLGGEDANIYELTENTEDLAYTLLYADAMGLAADAMVLAADEGVARLVTLFTSSAADYMEDAYEDYTDYDDFEDADEYSEEYIYNEEFADEEEYHEEYAVEPVEVADLAEAAGVYAGTLPAFTVPEGYVAESIYATEGDVSAYYVSGEKVFSFYVTDFGVDMGVDGPLYSEDAEAGVIYVEYVNGSTYVLFVFELGFDQSEMESILAGLTL